MLVVSVLPNEETREFITEFFSAFNTDSTEFSGFNITGVAGVSRGSRLTKDELGKRDVGVFDDFLVGSFNEGFRRLDEEGLVVVISVFNLVVELDVVPGDEVTNFLFNLIVTLVLVNGTREVGSLGSVSEEDVLVVNLFAQSLLEGDDVVSTGTIHNGKVIFVININTINVGVGIDVLSQLSGNGDGITRRVTGGTESADPKLFTVLVEGIQNVLLNFSIGGTVIIGTNVGVDVSPQTQSIRNVTGHPESQNNNVVAGAVETEGVQNGRTIPTGNGVNVSDLLEISGYVRVLFLSMLGSQETRA